MAEKIENFAKIVFIFGFCLQSILAASIGNGLSTGRLEISDFKLKTTIQMRYAISEVELILKNAHVDMHEARFDLTIPNEAFVSNFTMQINNEEIYVAKVMEKESAYQTYIQSGDSAGLVQQDSKFKVGKKVSVKFYFNT